MKEKKEHIAILRASIQERVVTCDCSPNDKLSTDCVRKVEQIITGIVPLHRIESLSKEASVRSLGQIGVNTCRAMKAKG